MCPNDHYHHDCLAPALQQGLPLCKVRLQRLLHARIDGSLLRCKARLQGGRQVWRTGRA